MSYKYDDIMTLLCKSCSVYGNSEEVADIFLWHSKSTKTYVGTDILGSASVLLKAPSKFFNPKNIIISTNIDTSGFLVQSFTEDSILLQPVGKGLFSGKFDVKIKTKVGYIETVLIVENDKYYILRESFPQGLCRDVSIGDPVFIFSSLKQTNGKYTYSTAGAKSNILAIMMAEDQLKKQVIQNNIFLVLPALNEFGCLGSIAAVSKIKPYIYVNLGLSRVAKKTDIGKGLRVFLDPRLNKTLSNFILDLAQKNKIPCTAIVDKWYIDSVIEKIPSANGGVVCININMPYYDTGSGVEIVSKKDISYMSKLLVEFINNIDILGPLGGTKWLAEDAKTKENKG